MSTLPSLKLASVDALGVALSNLIVFELDSDKWISHNMAGPRPIVAIDADFLPNDPITAIDDWSDRDHQHNARHASQSPYNQVGCHDIGMELRDAFRGQARQSFDVDPRGEMEVLDDLGGGFGAPWQIQSAAPVRPRLMRRNHEPCRADHSENGRHEHMAGRPWLMWAAGWARPPRGAIVRRQDASLVPSRACPRR